MGKIATNVVREERLRDAILPTLRSHSHQRVSRHNAFAERTNDQRIDFRFKHAWIAREPRQLHNCIRKRVEISVNKHGSRLVALVSHHDCAGNPVSKEEHMDQLADAMKVVVEWGLPARVLGLWVDEAWQVEFVYDTEA